MSLSAQQSIQTRTLRTFTVLHHLRQDWGGALIVACGLGPQGAALALASNIAGAVCLSIEPDPATAREALRTGACDFVVNTLDEALRAMKNEIRKHLPLSVGLQGNQAAILQELIDRGVAPELFTGLNQLAPAAATQSFKSSGAIIVDFNPSLPSHEASRPEAVNAESMLESILAQHQWQIESFAQSTPSALRAFDLRALSLISPEDTLRTKWLHAAPRILPRESPLHRTLWVTAAESETLQKSPQTEDAR
jgi:urocanate hydratase